MGNILQAIRVSVLHKRITALVEDLPKRMVTWKNRNDVVSTHASSKGVMMKYLEKAQEQKPELAKNPEPLKEFGLGSGEILCSRALRRISLCTDVDTDDSTPPPEKEVEAYEEISIVNWDYMTAVPIWTWEDVLEEQLWDDYTRQHSPPAGTVPIEELCRIEEGKDSTTIDLTESVDGDTVVLFQRSRRNLGSDADQSQTGDFQRDSQMSKNNTKPKRNRFLLLPYLLLKRFRIKDTIFRQTGAF